MSLESSKLLDIRAELQQNAEIKTMLDLLGGLQGRYDDLASDLFVQSEDYQLLKKKLAGLGL